MPKAPKADSGYSGNRLRKKILRNIPTRFSERLAQEGAIHVSNFEIYNMLKILHETCQPRRRRLVTSGQVKPDIIPLLVRATITLHTQKKQS